MPRSSKNTRGFSLVELVMAMAVSGILVGAMAATLVTASSALEQGTGTFGSERAAAEAMADLQSDLAEAIEFYERTSTSVWFSVPDRNGDKVNEHIRYAWSGVPGEPLTRSTNGNTPAAIASDVRAFDLGFVVRPGPTQTELAERLIASFTTHAGATQSSTTVTNTAWTAQIVRPSFAADTVSWKATRVRLPLRQSGAAEAWARFSIVPVSTDGVPGTTPYASVDIRETTFSTSQRADTISFPACNPIPANQPVAIVVSGITAGAAACDVGFLTSATPTMPFNLWRSSTANGGSTWQGYGQNQNTVFELYGTVTQETR